MFQTREIGGKIYYIVNGLVVGTKREEAIELSQSK